MSIGHKGMIVAAKVIAAAIMDLFSKPVELAKIRKEFKKKIEDVLPGKVLTEKEDLFCYGFDASSTEGSPLAVASRGSGW